MYFNYTEGLKFWNINLVWSRHYLVWFEALGGLKVGTVGLFRWQYSCIKDSVLLDLPCECGNVLLKQVKE